MNETKLSFSQDKLFRRIATGSTALGFASLAGLLASLSLSERGTFQFTWHWTILLWMAAAAVFNWRLWHALWQFQDAPSPRTKLKLILFSTAMAAVGIGSFLYPIRFLASTHYAAILRGLLTGVFFLGVIAVIMVSIARGLNETSPAQKKRNE